MKKNVFISFLCTMAIAFSLSSCRSAKEITTLDSLNGEWNIIEINGSEVAPGSGKDLPYIGFESASGKVYGNSGCNRIMGSFDTNAKAGEIDLGTLAGTRMMCPDMTLEQNVLNALKIVKGYKKVNGQKIALTNANKRPVIVLAPKVAVSLVSALQGEWKIAEIKGKAIPVGLDKEPFISFDTKTLRIHGNAGCNMINGGIVLEEDKPHAISFPAVAATMMACPDMGIERSVLDALNTVKAFDTLENKSIGLYNAEGTMVLLLKKK